MLITIQLLAFASSMSASSSSLDEPSLNSILWIVPVKGNGGHICNTPVGGPLDILIGPINQIRFEPQSPWSE